MLSNVRVPKLGVSGLRHKTCMCPLEYDMYLAYRVFLLCGATHIFPVFFTTSNSPSYHLRHTRFGRSRLLVAWKCSNPWHSRLTNQSIATLAYLAADSSPSYYVSRVEDIEGYYSINAPFATSHQEYIRALDLGERVFFRQYRLSCNRICQKQKKKSHHLSFSLSEAKKKIHY